MLSKICSVAPVVRVREPQLTVEAGQPAHLTCDVIQGNPPPHLHWTNQVSRSATQADRIKWISGPADRAYTVPNVIGFPRYNKKCSGENELLRGLFHAVSRFPLHFMLYRANLN